ncbi:hypothetical protein BHE16_09760 [Neomicrococcus aestuarii]|uniref:Uncharacterized protein n=1 Tax=Neomicrococcus aestuarii TaxID=556325 RepID=A0A1L2ZQB6_9MICC|nr:hypothetical protein BHE16_09760 [Neomicrococcus aestuarii]
MVVALVVGVSVLPGVFRSDSPVNSASESLSTLDPTLDSDADGIPDRAELSGWKVNDGNVYNTDPFNADTDDDGLSDHEEAGDLVAASDVATAYTGLSNPADRDSDDDGLEDNAEVHGWFVESGEKYFTNPMVADSDSDGLYDSDEAGKLLENEASSAVFEGYSNPQLSDSDDDGLNDAEEADSSSDPYASDTDADGLSDAQEVTLIGTDPTLQDTDSDGFNDAFEEENRVTKGLDPLFEDVEVSAWDYAGEFAKGALAGEAWPSDSIAWLAGNLASTGSSFIPGVGWIIGGVGDLRDTVAQAIRTDWVGAGFSASSLIPVTGDAVAIPAKVALFVAAYPLLAPKVGGLVQSMKDLPESVKLLISKQNWNQWEALLAAGSDKRALFRMQESGRMNLDGLSGMMTRPGHVSGPPAPFMAGGPAGENTLRVSLESQGLVVQNQVRFSMAGCLKVCNPTVRVIDSLSDGIAHESKVGYTSLTTTVRKQIESDAHLIQEGQITDARWHFYASASTAQIGPSKELVEELEKFNIPHTIHVPTTR